jgi:hypothetical protein
MITSHSQLSTTDSQLSPSPLLGTGPDLELPLPLPAPSSFTPFPPSPDVTLHASTLQPPHTDRGDHHYRLLSEELDRIEAKLALLNRFLASSYA